MTTSTDRCMPLLEVRHLVKHFVRRAGPLRPPSVVQAVDDVSFAIEEGEMFGLVGESGSGKSTTGRCILRLIEPTSGEVLFRGENVLGVLDEPHAAGAPRHADRLSGSVLVAQPAHARRRRSSRNRWSFTDWARGPSAARGSRSCSSWSGSSRDHLQRYPHEFSGGQRQRIGIARALALNPALIIADEAVSALDVSIQAQVVTLLLDLQERLKLTYLFIAHDLRLVEHICSRVAVMYLGKIVEIGETSALFAQPTHPYTRALLSAIPVLDPDAPRSGSSWIRDASIATAPLREVAAGHWAAV